LLNNNSMIPASGLIKALWPNGTPATGRKMPHNAISRVGAALGRLELEIVIGRMVARFPDA
jgi:hypothetical protein